MSTSNHNIPNNVPVDRDSATGPGAATPGLLASLQRAIATKVGNGKNHCPEKLQYCHVEAFINTVGPASAANTASQNAFAKWFSTHDELKGFVIGRTVANHKLAYKLTERGKVLATVTADPASISRVPSELLRKREQLVKEREYIGPKAAVAIEDLLGSMNMTPTQLPEVLGFVHEMCHELAAVGITDFRGEIRGLVERCTEENRAHMAGIPVEAFFEKYILAARSRSLYGRALRQLSRRLINFAVSRLTDSLKPNPPSREEAERQIKSNINNFDRPFAEAFIQSLPARSQGRMRRRLAGIWNKASQMAVFMTSEDRSVIAENVWLHIDTEDAPRFPICMAPAKAVQGVINAALIEFPAQALAIILEFLLGMRPSEAATGMDKKHRDEDGLVSLNIENVHFDGSEYWKLGYVDIPINKTRAQGVFYRRAPITPSSARYLRPVIEGYHAKGIYTGPIWRGSAGQVRKVRAILLKRFGVTDLIAERCKVSPDAVGKTCQANTSIGRHTYLTFMFYAFVKIGGKDISVVRHFAGHSKDSKVLEESYLTMTTEHETNHYVDGLYPPAGFKFDPEYTEWKRVWAQRRADGNRRNWDALKKAGEHNAKNDAMHEGRRRALANPEKRAKMTGSIAAGMKAFWASLSQEERDGRGAMMREARRKKSEERERRRAQGGESGAGS